MALLPQYPLPLTSLPTGYQSSERALSVSSSPSECGDAIHDRDKFLGCPRCVICGEQSLAIQIVKESQEDLWSDLKRRKWIPSQGKQHPAHDPRNGVVLCLNHSIMFDVNRFFIRFIPKTKQYVLVNYTDNPDLLLFHGKALALDHAHPHAPFPALFLLHEMRVRESNPVHATALDMPYDIPWQDWLAEYGALRSGEGEGLFNRDLPPPRSTGVRTTGGPPMKKLSFPRRGCASRNRGGDACDVVVSRVSAGGPELGRHGRGEYTAVRRSCLHGI